jgi:DNA replication protein DnaC
VSKPDLRSRCEWHKAFLPPMPIPVRFNEAEPSGMPAGVVRDCIEHYLKNFWALASVGQAPALTGRAGSWKTYGAWCVARFAWEQLLPTEFVECGPFFTEADAQFYSGSLKNCKRISEVPFLVLDDYTQVKPGTRAVELMANVVGQRFSANLPTLFTGNFAIRDVRDLARVANEYRPDFARRIWHGAGGGQPTGLLIAT